jgi:hypothetical protein
MDLSGTGIVFGLDGTVTSRSPSRITYGSIECDAPFAARRNEWPWPFFRGNPSQRLLTAQS